MKKDGILITGAAKRVGLHLARFSLERAVDYLLESVYVTGRILHMDGGRHLKVA